MNQNAGRTESIMKIYIDKWEDFFSLRNKWNYEFISEIHSKFQPVNFLSDPSWVREVAHVWKIWAPADTSGHSLSPDVSLAIRVRWEVSSPQSTANDRLWPGNDRFHSIIGEMKITFVFRAHVFSRFASITCICIALWLAELRSLLLLSIESCIIFAP